MDSAVCVRSVIIMRPLFSLKRDKPYLNIHDSFWMCQKIPIKAVLLIFWPNSLKACVEHMLLKNKWPATIDFVISGGGFKNRVLKHPIEYFQGLCKHDSIFKAYKTYDGFGPCHVIHKLRLLKDIDTIYFRLLWTKNF